MDTLASTVAPLTSDNAPLWTGGDFTTDDYIIALEEAQVAEVTDAVAVACRRLAGRDLSRDTTIDAADFPLPRLGSVLRQAAKEVENGRGFTLLRGFPVDQLSGIEVSVLVRGLASHLAPIATQSRDGQLIRHVLATHGGLGNAVTRGHETTERLWFHTDGADAAMLLCWRPSSTGGLSRLASAGAVHNAALERAPDLVAVLYEPFHFHMSGGNVPGLPTTFISPIFSLYRRRFSVRYVRHTLLETPQVTGVLHSRRALAAFDLLETIADGVSVDMQLRAGDLQIVNNHTVLHSRTEYADRDPDSARHLLRCWLTFDSYAGRRPGAVDEALRYGWLADDDQHQAARTWSPPLMPLDPAPAA